MKKSYIIGIAALAVAGLASCQADKDPKISTATEFVLDTPATADETMVLTPEGTATFTVTQPNYGIQLAPTYGIEVSLTEDFTALKEGTYEDAEGEEVEIPDYVVIPLESQTKGELIVKESHLAAAICAMRGIGKPEDFTEEDPRPLYVRATSIVGNHESTSITSNVVTLSKVKEYFATEAAAPDAVLYTPGGANGWNFDNSIRIPSVEPNVYEGYMAVDGDFKITNQAGWSNPGNYGCAEAFTEDKNGVWSGTLVENGGNISGIDPGLYWAQIKITDPEAPNDAVCGTVKLTPIKTVGIVGDFNGWANDVEMTPEIGYGVWKAADVDLAGGGWKIRMNGDWPYNLGVDKDGNVVPNGDNFSEGGTHTVVLDFTTLPYTVRFE